MKTVIHINRHVIRANRTSGRHDPPITVKTYKGAQRASRAAIIGEDGQPVAVVRYEPDHPLSCGATVWIETHLRVETN